MDGLQLLHGKAMHYLREPKMSLHFILTCFQSTMDNTGGVGQNLVSPGSCLEEFRSTPVLECHGHGNCNYQSTVASFWLTVIEEQDQFVQPQQQTLKADQTSKISR